MARSTFFRCDGALRRPPTGRRPIGRHTGRRVHTKGRDFGLEFMLVFSKVFREGVMIETVLQL